MYNGVCSYCHEETLIEQQYIELDMEVPVSIYNKAREQYKEIYKNRKRERKIYAVEDSYGYQHFRGTHEECVKWMREHREVRGIICYYGE